VLCPEICIGHDPADRQQGGQCSLDHAPGQFGFGLKTDHFRDMSCLPMSHVVDPIFWQVQFAIDKGMSQGGHVGEEDANLTIVHLSGRAAILLLDSGRLGAPFGKATFINDVHGIGCLVSNTRTLWRRVQALQSVRPQLIANPLFIPDGPREQALHAIRTGLLGVFCNLPAIFSGDLADNGLQIEQRVLAWFGASKVGSQALMQVDQGQRPASYLLEGWSGIIPCGMVLRLHAVLVSDGHLSRCFFFLVECHIKSEKSTRFFLAWGDLRIRLQVPL